MECGITKTPFDSGQFDVIFSNHVIEQVHDLKSAFRETQRIGTSSCIYAFSVPTNIWLLLSIPGISIALTIVVALMASVVRYCRKK